MKKECKAKLPGGYTLYELTNPAGKTALIMEDSFGMVIMHGEPEDREAMIKAIGDVWGDQNDTDADQ